MKLPGALWRRSRKPTWFLTLPSCILAKTRDGQLFLLSTEDKDLLEFRWRMNPHGYIERTTTTGTKGNYRPKNLFLHKIIADRLGLSAPTKFFIDHKNRIRVDNRRNNLRNLTPKDSNLNTGKRKTNTSGFTGIFPVKEIGRRQKYVVVCSTKRKRVYTLDEAKNLRDTWLRQELIDRKML